MDKAIIDNIIVSAYEISLNYDKEKIIRRYSRNKKILCSDPHCKNPVLRYCHGDKKSAYFAHLINTECDYNEFDRNDNALFKELRIKLFHHFTSLGYKVQTECKLLDHHYSPIYCMKDSESFVIEIGDSKTTISYVENILKDYSLKNISVKWLVVGDEIVFSKENKVSFLKRFLLNESKNNDFILINGNKMIQYRLDKKLYKLNLFREIYSEEAELRELCLEDGELSINGFNSRYFIWQQNKEVEIDKEIKRREEQERAFDKKQESEKNFIQLTNKKNRLYSYVVKNTHNCVSKTKKTYTCIKCGKIACESEFYMMQGNSGTCWECHYGPEKYQEVKKYRGS